MVSQWRISFAWRHKQTIYFFRPQWVGPVTHLTQSCYCETLLGNSCSRSLQYFLFVLVPDLIYLFLFFWNGTFVLIVPFPDRCFHLSFPCMASLLGIRNVKTEPVHEKTNNFGFGPDPTQTDLYRHRGRLEA